AGAAVLAWRAAHRSADAAETLAGIEQRRLQRELTPQIRVKAAPLNPGAPRIQLTVWWDDPDSLDRLDSVRVVVRDDRPRKASGVAGAPTQAEVDETIWGPYRFALGADGADGTGRTVAEFPLARGEPKRLQMEPTVAPPWVSDPAAWREEFLGRPIRLQFSCSGEGEQWVVKREVFES